MTPRDPAGGLRPGSLLMFSLDCRHCRRPVGECYPLWCAEGRLCCQSCDHRRELPPRGPRPHPTVRAMPRGWSPEGLNAHVEASKRVLHLLSGLGVGRELGSEEGRSEVQDRIRQYTAQLLDDTGTADTREMPRVPEQRAMTSREATA